MDNRNNAMWLIFAVALGLFAYSISGILANGFHMYKLYIPILGAINLLALYLLRK